MIYLLPHSVDQAAAALPDRCAFRAPGESLTYAQLAERSNQLAHLLIERGVQRGDRVGVFMPRAVDSALAVYGIMKAGAAFVPIDPHMPVAGLRSLCEDCGIEHLVAHPQTARSVEALAEGPHNLRTIIGLELDLGELQVCPWSDLAAFPFGCAPDLRLMEEDIAYLMYSSGSTGRPKGIVHTHRSGLAYVRLSTETYQVSSEDRIGNHSALHFDMSTFGYLTSPFAQATTVLIPEAYTKLTASLSQLMETEKLTIWYSVPLALIQLLLRGVLEQRDLSSLRWVLFGGEPYARKHMEALMALWPHARFSNVYGPAEVNQCTYFHVPPLVDMKKEEATSEPVPIGQVWANSEGLVLDRQDEPVGEGEVGELVVRSPTRMRGYWGRPDLDEDAFFVRRTAAPGEDVFYRTGDLVQTLPSGDLHFLGRMDRQVKVRGYRLELDEIERTLCSHQSVEEAAVFPVRRDGQIEHLEAATTLKVSEDTQETVSPKELLAFLANLVSWYAMPATVEVLEQFPRTTSGKIDRRRLQQRAEDRVTPS